MKLVIVRDAYVDDGTFGTLRVLGRAPFALTLEREWADNEPRKSCIPAGVYQCRRVNSPKFGDTFEVQAVPGRSHILFHAGNLSDDSLGCILVGEQFEFVNGKPGIVASRQGFGEFLRVTQGVDTFTLLIEDAPSAAQGQG